MAKISVIIPVYNTQEYIGSCVESVLGQQGVDLECIVVDDCCTDGSMRIVENFADDRIRIVRHSHNRGQSAARNNGFGVSTGDWIFYLDSDDQLTDNALRTMSALVTPQVDWVEGSYERVSPEKTWQTISLAAHYKSHDQIEAAYDSVNFMNASNKLINRRIAQHQFCEGLIFEDTLWCQQLYPTIQNIVVIDVPTYRQNIRSNSIMQSSFSPKKVDSQLYIIEQITPQDPSANQQRTMTYLAMNLIKNLYLGDFSDQYRQQAMQRLAQTGVYKMEIDRRSLPPFTRILSLNFRKSHYFYYKFISQIYKTYKRLGI